MRRWSFTKGHGTENDFVVILDREGTLDIGPAEVRFLCDRHAGVGGDGLLRVVRARHVAEGDNPDPTMDGSLWFMDYRNADGSIAEMCGNGVRVFVRFLLENSLVSGHVIPVATRGGLKEATLLRDGQIRVAMGPVRVEPGEVEVTTVDGEVFAAVGADVGNPHAVSFSDDLGHLRLHDAPRWEPAERFPHGVNLEFVRRLGPRHIEMRVHERGSGETRSCGTGTVAAAAVAHAAGPDPEASPATYRVDVPGGTVHVELAPDQAYLTGPAVLVAHGEVSVPAEILIPKEG
ncbi:MAG TPA: diaminopimelate epimerase [Propionibacteriaceae bacterium]